MSRDGHKTGHASRRDRETMSIGEAYTLLGLTPLADREVVHATYRQLVLRYHPDKGGGNMERFKELATAYRLLQNKFRLEHTDADEARGECDHCGTYDVLRKSPDGSQCCSSCLALSGRRRLLPAPPVVIVSCATTIILLCLAAGCLLAGCASKTTRYPLAAIGFGIASLISLAVTCATVIYTAEPRHLRPRAPHSMNEDHAVSESPSHTLYCPQCGYNLTGLPENRCPECGRAFDPAQLTRGKHPGEDPISAREWIVYLLGMPIAAWILAAISAACATFQSSLPLILMMPIALMLLPVGLAMSLVAAERFTARRVFLTRGPVNNHAPWLELPLFFVMLVWLVVVTLLPVGFLMMAIGY